MARNEKKDTPEIKCTMCGTIKKANSNNFYKSYSKLFKANYENRMCVCKDCIVNEVDLLTSVYGNEKKALYEVCSLLDIFFSKSLYESAVEQASSKNSNVSQIYLQKINSLPQYKGKTFKESDNYNETDEINEISEEIGRDVMAFWGKGGLSSDDYEFLENEYETLLQRFECDSYSQEMLFQEIAHQRLDIKKKRQQGASVDKELKTLQDLLGSANVKPAQENSSMASEQVTFGTLIKKYENEEPIPEPLESWTNADWIRKYVVVWFLGHMCKMMGINNPYADEYEEEIKKYTVSQMEDDE